MLTGHWLALYNCWHVPVGQLWTATCADPRLWLPIFAEIIPSARSMSGTLPDVGWILHAWPLSARHLASVLLATSSNPETATLGRALQHDVLQECR